MNSDDLGLFGSDSEKPARSRKDTREQRERPQRKRRNRVKLWITLLVAAVAIGGGVWFGAIQLLGIGAYEDFQGDGESDVVVQVGQGETVSRFAKRLVEAGVIGSTKALTVAAETTTQVTDTQPGYYLMKTKMSGAAAAARLVQKESRVGAFEVKGGFKLEDITGTDQKVRPGILSLIAQASCAELNGKSTCVTVDTLRTAMAQTDPAGLGVPEWAVADVAKAEPKHRLEGLVYPGRYDVKPGSTAVELLKSVMDVSASRLLGAVGMPKAAADSGYSPYQVLVIASLVEKEGITKDFGKVSRVIRNRLAKDNKLEFDSTVNYGLAKPTELTTREDRNRPGPYNTYATNGLPPTPIASPGIDAFKAAIAPEEGNWFFFVKCYKDGTSCFTDNDAQHEKNKKDAQARGAYG